MALPARIPQRESNTYLSGASGMAIMHAILEGERDPWSLALDSVLIPYPQA